MGRQFGALFKTTIQCNEFLVNFVYKLTQIKTPGSYIMTYRVQKFD